MAVKDIEKLILKRLSAKKELRVAEIVKATGFSRAYVARFFQELAKSGKIALIGKANQARYVLAVKSHGAKKGILSVRRILRNTGLSEDLVLDEIKAGSGIFDGLPKNVADILDYAFTEMLNNAIEHSRSREITVRATREAKAVNFEVVDSGIGIFNNIIRKRKLKSELEAIQDLMKGKQTTAPKEHTGEGIFFTSKVADKLIIQSSRKKLIFDNFLKDTFITDVKNTIGTKVFFVISVGSRTNLDDIFRQYAGPAFAFGRTEVAIRLYKLDTDFISRSQARRVLAGLEKFKTVILDFKGVEAVGQGFADEVFRVWQNHHRGIELKYQNANENIAFMIRRAMAVK